MARRKHPAPGSKDRTDVVPRLRAAVKIVDEALDEIARQTARPRKPGAKRPRKPG